MGEITEAEKFINWDKLDDNEDEDEVYAIGSPEVLRVARQWSVDLIIEHPESRQGIVGFL